MKVTSVTFNHLHNRSPRDKVKAYAKIILDEELIITGVKVIVTDTKRFIVFPEEKINPSKTRGEHVVVSLVNPITSGLRNHITETVFEKFDTDPFNPANKAEINNATKDSNPEGQNK
jgi:DNA-binding cell septation regulator SpoVG